jgi:hypothetical protein
MFPPSFISNNICHFAATTCLDHLMQMPSLSSPCLISSYLDSMIILLPRLLVAGCGISIHAMDGFVHICNCHRKWVLGLKGLIVMAPFSLARLGTSAAGERPPPPPSNLLLNRAPKGSVFRERAPSSKTALPGF